MVLFAAVFSYYFYLLFICNTARCHRNFFGSGLKWHTVCHCDWTVVELVFWSSVNLTCKDESFSWAFELSWARLYWATTDMSIHQYRDEMNWCFEVTVWQQQFEQFRLFFDLSPHRYSPDVVFLQELIQPYVRFLHKRLSADYTFIEGTCQKVMKYSREHFSCMDYWNFIYNEILWNTTKWGNLA